MGVVKGAWETRPPWILKILETSCFLISSEKKQILPLLSPPKKLLEKSPSGPSWKKSFRRPCTLGGMKESVSLSLQYILPSSALFAKQFKH